MERVASIYLTNENQATDWQKDATIQHKNGDIFIYMSTFDKYTHRQIQQAARKIESMGVEHAKLQGELWQEDFQWAFALGFTCVNKLSNVEFAGSDALINRLNDKLAVYAWSRDLTNTPATEVTPLALAEKASSYIASHAPAYVSTRTISGDELLEQGWVGVYNVGKASVNPPCLVEIDYNPTQDESTEVDTCLIGKGITFDTGGYSIKANEGMFDMKADMGGSAVVAGALALAIRQGLNKRVKLILCCAENMISGLAYKNSDILTYKNGVTCEVANTDAEGRIILADGLLLAAESNPKVTIDAATLTGAAVLATGGDYTALFSLDDQAAQRAQAAATEVNEPMWRLPLEPWHKDKCPSAFADTANSRTQKGGGAGGASNAAGFLARFAPNNGEGWLHFDLAAAYNGKSDGMWAAGATGISIATIAQLMLTNH